MPKASLKNLNSFSQTKSVQAGASPRQDSSNNPALSDL